MKCQPVIRYEMPSGTKRLRIAVGPVAPGWGSWEWIGADLVPVLQQWCHASTFDSTGAVDCDVMIVIKHPLSVPMIRNLSPRARLIYAPVDRYGSAAEIDADQEWLACCDRIVVHSERLRKYFAPYAGVDFLDHHVKFIGSRMSSRWNRHGPILWIGVRSNLPPLVDWINCHPLPRPLLVLTNPEQDGDIRHPEGFGFRDARNVRVETWSSERHLAAIEQACAAIDVKGDDFRARHKPPAKALDYLAAGVPVAMNSMSSSVEHLARLGFDIPEPADHQTWFSEAYWEETVRFGGALRELLALPRIGRRWMEVIQSVCHLPGRRDTLPLLQQRISR